MKRWLIWGAVVGALVVLVIVSSRPDPVEVTLVRVEKGRVERTVANTRAGTVKACQRSRLSLPIGGQIAELHAREGDRVVAGQLLMSLWNEDRAARLQEAEASRVSAEKERDSVCIAASSDIREARRLTRLATQKLISQESADLAQSRAEASEAACEAAKARIKQAAAAVAVARATLDQTYLKAPFAGIVAEVTGEVGEFSTPSPPGVATPPAIDLLTDTCHYVSAPIDEVDASDIAVGLPVRVTLDAFRDRVFPARVRRIFPYIQDYEKQARTVEVEAELDPLPEGVTLLAGYSADMEIILESRGNRLRVPSELVVAGDNHVLVVGEDSHLVKREVIRGLANWRYTEILDGLGEGDAIVSNIGNTGVVEGARVKVTSGGNADADN